MKIFVKIINNCSECPNCHHRDADCEKIGFLHSDYYGDEEDFDLYEKVHKNCPLQNIEIKE